MARTSSYMGNVKLEFFGIVKLKIQKNEVQTTIKPIAYDEQSPKRKEKPEKNCFLIVNSPHLLRKQISSYLFLWAIHTRRNCFRKKNLRKNLLAS